MHISGPTYDFIWSNVNNAPDKQGVYILYQDSKVTYIGSVTDPGETLRSHLQAHKRGDLGTSTQGVTTFQTEATQNSVNAAKRERNLQFINGRPARCHDPLLRYS